MKKNKSKKILILGVIVIAAIYGIILYNYSGSEDYSKSTKVLEDGTQLAYTINGTESTEPFPSKSSGYTVKSLTCENGATASWDATNWGLTNIVANGNNAIRCTIDFDASYSRFVVSTTDSCIYNGSKCSSNYTTPVEVSYKPDGSTAVSFYVLDDDGTTLTLITKDSIGSKAWSSSVNYTSGPGTTTSYALGYAENYTKSWSYVNSQTYTLNSAYEISYGTGKSGSYNMPTITTANYSLTRTNVKARLIDYNDLSTRIGDGNSIAAVAAGVSWLQDKGWTSFATPISTTTSGSESDATTTSSGTAWFINSYATYTGIVYAPLAKGTPTTTKAVHPVVEISKSLLLP